MTDVFLKSENLDTGIDLQEGMMKSRDIDEESHLEDKKFLKLPEVGMDPSLVSSEGE